MMVDPQDSPWVATHQRTAFKLTSPKSHEWDFLGPLEVFLSRNQKAKRWGVSWWRLMACCFVSCDANRLPFFPKNSSSFSDALSA
jgi:hypothetical protein